MWNVSHHAVTRLAQRWSLCYQGNPYTFLAALKGDAIFYGPSPCGRHHAYTHHALPGAALLVSEDLTLISIIPLEPKAHRTTPDSHKRYARRHKRGHSCT